MHTFLMAFHFFVPSNISVLIWHTSYKEKKQSKFHFVYSSKNHVVPLLVVLLVCNLHRDVVGVWDEIYSKNDGKIVSKIVEGEEQQNNR